MNDNDENEVARLAEMIRMVYEETSHTNVTAAAGDYELRHQQQHEVGLAAIAVLGRALMAGKLEKDELT